MLNTNIKNDFYFILLKLIIIHNINMFYLSILTIIYSIYINKISDGKFDSLQLLEAYRCVCRRYLLAIDYFCLPHPLVALAEFNSPPVRVSVPEFGE